MGVVMVSVIVGVTVRVCHRDMTVRVPMVRTEHEEESPRHQQSGDALAPQHGLPQQAP